MSFAGPLQGVSVLVTRPKEGAGSLAQALEALGAAVRLAPAIEVGPPVDFAPLDRLLAGLAGADWLLFTSANGVRGLVARATELGEPLPAAAPPRLAAVGPATAAALGAAWRAPDLTAAGTATDLAEALGDVRGLRIALARADIARDDLPRALAERGACVDDCIAYRVTPAALGHRALAGPAPDCIALASPSAVRALDAALRDAGLLAWWDRARLACIGPVTAGALRAIGREPHCVSSVQTAAGLATAVLEDHLRHA